MCCVANTDQAAPDPQSERPTEAPHRLPDATFTTDHAGCVTGWSTQAAALFERPAADALGLKWDVLFEPDMPGHLEEALSRAAQGQSYSEAVSVKTGAGRLPLLLNCCPLTGASGETSVLCTVGRIGSDRRSESRAAFMDELMTKSPFGLAMIDENLRYVQVNDALAAINGIPADAHNGRPVRDVILTKDDAAFERCMRETLRTGEPQHSMPVSGRTEGHPDTDRSWTVSLFRLTSRDGQVLGLGAIVVDVTDRQSALREASAARQRLALVNEASTRVGTTLEMPQIARELASVAVPAFADLAVVKIRDDLFGDTVPEVSGLPIHLRRLAGLDAMNTVASDELYRSHKEVSRAPGTLLYESMRRREAILLGVIDDEAVAAMAPDEEQARLVRASGLGSMIIAPFVARDRVLGVALFGRSVNRDPLNAEDLRSAKELATRTAMCLDNALAYSNERRIAVALQQSMLPEEDVIPQRSGLEIAHHYRPSSNAAQVGGDWFDVIALSGHRIALVVGDVMGHDIHAAATMGQLRTAMRTLARLDLEPVDLLARLDEAVQKGTTMQYATCVYAVCDTVTRECSIVSAGHPPPLLRHADGTTEVLTVSPGVPLGVGTGEPDFVATDLVLPEDSTLVLYTDGLVEHRGEDIDTGIENLRALLAADADSVSDLCDRVATRLGHSVAEDDLAVLMARMPSGSDHGFAEQSLVPRPESVSQARSFVRRTLAAWALPDLVDATMLLVSELVTNAIRYAQGDIALRLAKGGALVCEVADGDVHVPRRRHPGPDEEGGRGLTVVSEYSQAWGTRPTSTGKVVWFELALPDQ